MKILALIVDCNFGVYGEKTTSYSSIRDPKKFKAKECRITKIIPVSFKPLPVAKRCQNLIVEI